MDAPARAAGRIFHFRIRVWKGTRTAPMMRNVALVAPGAGSDVMATVPYVNDATGGQVEQAAFIFYAGVPITAGKTVQAVTLPGGGVSDASNHQPATACQT